MTVEAIAFDQIAVANRQTFGKLMRIVRIFPNDAIVQIRCGGYDAGCQQAEGQRQG